MVEHFSWSGGDGVGLSIEVLDFHGNSRECFEEGDFLGNDKVSASALEDRVLLDLYAHVDVARDDARLSQQNITYSSFSPVKM